MVGRTRWSVPSLSSKHRKLKCLVQLWAMNGDNVCSCLSERMWDFL